MPALDLVPKHLQEARAKLFKDMLEGRVKSPHKVEKTERVAYGGKLIPIKGWAFTYKRRNKLAIAAIVTPYLQNAA